jgi:hypothetical protein
VKYTLNALLIAVVFCGLILPDASLAAVADEPTPNEGASNSEFAVLGSNSTLSEPIFNRTASEITFTVTGPSGTQGYVWCQIAENLIPHTDASKNLKVLLDGNQINYMYTFNDGAWQLFFNYTHSTHQVTISLPKETATIFGIDSPTFVAVFAAACVVLGMAVVVWRRKQKPTAMHQ